MVNASIGLAAALDALRQELLTAIGEGEGSLMRFRLASIDLSLQVAVTKEGEGRIGWKVLGLGASYEASTTQTLNLKLEPVWLKSDGSYTDDFLIASQETQAPSFGPRS